MQPDAIQFLKDTAITAADTGGPYLNAALIEMGMLAASDPKLMIFLGLCKIFIALPMGARKTRAIEFMQFLKDNTPMLSESLFEMESFQDGLLHSFETFLRERNEAKRRAVQRIFLGFAASGDKERFQLERFNAVLSQISLEAIEYLSFINNLILPRMTKHWEEDAARLSAIPISAGGQDAAWWMKSYRNTDPVTKHIKKWIYDTYDPNTEGVKARHNYDGQDHEKLNAIYALKQPEDRHLAEMTAELLSLGIFRTILTGGGSIGGDPPDEHTFTDFGWAFLSYVAFPNIKIAIAEAN